MVAGDGIRGLLQGTLFCPNPGQSVVSHFEFLATPLRTQRLLINSLLCVFAPLRENNFKLSHCRSVQPVLLLQEAEDFGPDLFNGAGNITKEHIEQLFFRKPAIITDKAALRTRVTDHIQPHFLGHEPA